MDAPHPEFSWIISSLGFKIKKYTTEFPNAKLLSTLYVNLLL